MALSILTTILYPSCGTKRRLGASQTAGKVKDKALVFAGIILDQYKPKQTQPMLLRVGEVCAQKPSKQLISHTDSHLPTVVTGCKHFHIKWAAQIFSFTPPLYPEDQSSSGKPGVLTVMITERIIKALGNTPREKKKPSGVSHFNRKFSDFLLQH